MKRFFKTFLVIICFLSLTSLVQGQGSSLQELNKKVLTLYEQGRYTEAIPVAQEALSVAEKALGPDHPDVATSLNNLAELYTEMGREPEAKECAERVRKVQSKER